MYIVHLYTSMYVQRCSYRYYVQGYVYIEVCMYKHVHCTGMYACIYTCVATHVYVFTNVCMNIIRCKYVYKYVCVCMYV